ISVSLGVFTDRFALVLSAYLILNPLHDAACENALHRYEATTQARGHRPDAPRGVVRLSVPSRPGR
ncbi:hypothetical protein, partial [Paraburkholderia ribeironis]|uniref:hypothetical protein n=1 Tax=Paraburkholderia ribeironis TaxID=1247936 RepID=UPI001C3F8580